MKKLLSLALVIIMTASLMIAVGASGTDEPQNGDLLGTVDFSGSNFTDGRGSHWNKTNAQVSDNGDSVTVEYTDDKRNDGDENRGRARYGSDKMSAYKTAGNSYTVEFTIDSKAYVGVMLDGNTGFIINPALNSTSVGQTNVMDNMDFETYDGTGASKQTYAIEMTCAAETSKSYDGSLDVYAPTVYRLFVKDEANDSWRLVREITDSAELSRFEFESGGYDYFYFAVTRYGDDEYNFDSENDNAPVKSTVSNVNIYKGIDFITKGESAIVVPPEDENNAGDPPITNPSGGNTNNNNDKTTNTEKQDTEAQTEAQTEAEAQKGCGSVIAGVGAALVSACAAGFVISNRKKKED